jgi:hypothetical protein
MLFGAIFLPQRGISPLVNIGSIALFLEILSETGISTLKS